MKFWQMDQLKMVCTRSWTFENGLYCGRWFQHHKWGKFSIVFIHTSTSLHHFVGWSALHSFSPKLLWSVSSLEADIPRCFGDMHFNAVSRSPQLNVDHCSQEDRLESGDKMAECPSERIGEGLGPYQVVPCDWFPLLCQKAGSNVNACTIYFPDEVFTASWGIGDDRCRHQWVMRTRTSSLLHVDCRQLAAYVNPPGLSLGEVRVNRKGDAFCCTTAAGSQ